MVKLGSTLESSRKDKRLANSDNIYDKKLGKMQEEINQEVSSLSPVDEEDLTRSFDDNGRSVTKFADRSYSPQNFSGKGYKILRKNIKPVSLAVTKIVVSSVPTSDGYISFIINGIENHVDVVASTDTTTDKVADKIAAKLSATMTEYEVSKDASTINITRKFGGDVSSPSSFSAVSTGASCSITDSTKKELRNILMPIMMNQSNTIYEIRYDFDLDGNEIIIPDNCILKFEGGMLRNGRLASFKIDLERCTKKNFSNIEFVGKCFIDGKEATTKLDIINRSLHFYTNLAFVNNETNIVQLLEPARNLGFNDFQWVVSNNSLPIDEQIRLIEKYKINITDIKLHTSITEKNRSNYVSLFIKNVIPLIEKYQSIKHVYISNENTTNVSKQEDASILVSIANIVHSYGKKVGVSTNYSPSIINKILLDELDIIGKNYYPKIPYLKERTTFDNVLKTRAENYFNGYSLYNKELTFTEAGCMPFYENSLNPVDYQIGNKFETINIDKDFIFTKCFFDTVFYAAKTNGIKDICMWYIECFGKYRDYYSNFSKGALDSLYNYFLNI
jgi:hypothetical protein